MKALGRISRAKQIHMIKMAKSCAIAVGLTLCCNVPFTITYSQPANDTLLLSVLWSVTISLSASSLNSLVFFWNNPILRAEAKKSLKTSVFTGKLIVRNSLYVWKIILQGPSRDLSGKGVGTNFIAI